MRKIILPISLFLAIGLVFLFLKLGVFNLSNSLPKLNPSDAVSKLIDKDTISKIIDEVALIAPPPLRARFETQEAFLTSKGVIAAANEERITLGFARLTENVLLNSAAEAKASDLFQKQYFEHVSPTGIDASDLAQSLGYQFVTIGENLALGNYKDDVTLVRAWMESPGHRANILNGRFTEIGVAVKKGVFEGRSTWVGVQIFAKPISVCPSVDEHLKTQISEIERAIDEAKARLDEMRTDLESRKPKNRKEQEEYEAAVETYNQLVKETNARIEDLKVLVTTYNQQVSAFNQCVEE